MLIVFFLAEADRAALPSGLATHPFASCGKAVAEHGQSALRFGFGRLVLEYVPMLGQGAVLDPPHGGGDPCRGSSNTRKAPVDDDVVAFCEDEAVLIAQAVGKAADEPEQSFAAGFDVSAVLDVFVGPEAGRRLVVTFVEQRIKCCEHERLVLLRCGAGHVSGPST